MKALELQKAIYGALKADAGLASALTGIYDHRPLDAAPPVLVLGAATVSEYRAQAVAGTSHSLTLHLWTRGPGQAEAKALLSDVRACLDAAAFAIPGAQVVRRSMPFAEILQEPDTGLVHGVLRLEALLVAL